jgi:hypothetical protein
MLFAVHRYDHNTRLLPYLLAALTDEAASVSIIASAALQVRNISVLTIC